MPISTRHQKEYVSTRRLPRQKPISSSEAKQRAKQKFTSGGISHKLDQVYNYLLTARIATTHQIQSFIDVAPRTLRGYQENYWIFANTMPDQLSLPQVDILTDNKVWILGSVGMEYAKLDGRLPSSHVGYNFNHQTHDLLCNHTITHIKDRAAGAGHSLVWYGAYEARIINSDKRVTIEPDARLDLFDRSGEPSHCYYFEYHNERGSDRAMDKIDRYERHAISHSYRNYWDSKTPPTVLITYTHKAVYTGYVQALSQYSQTRDIRCKYWSMPLRRIMKDERSDLWVDLNARLLDRQEQVKLF